jgi:hypothetical protein
MPRALAFALNQGKKTLITDTIPPAIASICAVENPFFVPMDVSHAFYDINPLSISEIGVYGME